MLCSCYIMYVLYILFYSFIYSFLAVEMSKYSTELTLETGSHYKQLCPELTLEWITVHTEDVITTCLQLHPNCQFVLIFHGTQILMTKPRSSEKLKMWNKHYWPGAASASGKELPAGRGWHRWEHFVAAHESSAHYLCAWSLQVTITSLASPW